MQRTKYIFKVDDIARFKQNLLVWAQKSDTVVWLDSNKYTQKYTSFDAVLAIDEFTAIKTDYTHAFDKLKEYQSYTKDYLFGYISYDVKNDVENLTSTNFDGLDFADLYFFQPQKLFFIRGNEVEFLYLKMIDDEIATDFDEISKLIKEQDQTVTERILPVGRQGKMVTERSRMVTERSRSHENSKTLQNCSKTPNPIKIKLRIHKDAYHKKVQKVLAHIHRGDIYEANFCQEFYAENTVINPLEVYQHLNEISEPPFATFLKIEHQYVLSASPERYIKKEEAKIISQPIKGTAKRLQSAIDDAKIASDLAKDPKERAENVMIVDLVRNDLSKTATKGSVQVEELCKVYSFKQVHQLISTVVATVDEDTHPVDILRTTFPMGSMTGAPKISAMKIIENLEETKRGLYSGTVGYFTPEGNFDFNVIIRSILYNEEKKYVSYSVGGAITAKSIPEKEYEECLLKAKAMRFVLSK